jgi:beta-lactamase class A
LPPVISPKILIAAALALALTACAPATPQPMAPTAAPQEIQARITEMLHNRTDGAIGFYLKEVDGSVLAALNQNEIFEPASTIKALFLLYVMQHVQRGDVNLNMPIHVYTTPPTSSCPGAATTKTEPLVDALRLMMQKSDNERTKAISETFGIDNINALAQTIGMTHTRVNHTIGCGDQARFNHNTMTLVDAARLFEGVADGTLLDAANRQTFFSLMSGKQQYDETGSDPAAIWNPAMRLLVQQEAPADLSTAARDDFLKQMNLVYKDGRYILCIDGMCPEYRSVAGWAEIPFCGNAGITRRQYVFGLFIDGGTDPVHVDAAFDATKVELLREQIRSALSNWQDCAGKINFP